MKKLSLVAVALLAGVLTAPAQPQVLKDAERALKDGKTPAEVIAIITPAFSDPETSTLAQTYYIPGKAMFDEFDQLYALKQFNKLPEGGAIAMGNDLLGGYAFYMQALPLDSVKNEKGKVKTKYSKDIINTIAGHYGDYNQAAVDFWEAKQYMNAYMAWDCFINIVENPTFAAKVANVPTDTVVGEIAFNQALAAWQADSLQLALNSFRFAQSKGYNKKTLYDYALAVAVSLGDDLTTFEVAKQGMEAYGSEDPTYIGYVINYYLQNKQFEQAFAMVDEAIASDPNNAQYYFIKGILYDNQDKKAEAKAEFRKAIDMDPENWQALLQYGRVLCEEAYALSDAAPTTAAEYEAYFNEKIVPLFKEAADYLEKSWNINSENPEALRYLENIYYNLHDDAMMQDVENRKNNL